MLDGLCEDGLVQEATKLPDEKNVIDYKSHEDRSQEVQLGSYFSKASTGDLNCLVSKFPNKGNLDHQAQILESAS